MVKINFAQRTKPTIDIATKTKSDAMKKITASWEKK